MYNLPELHRQMLDVLGIEDVDTIVPDTDDIQPVDPITAVQNLINGKPVKAFEYQDHDAHIKAHMTIMQDPEMIQMMEASPMAQSIQGAFQAHITEHLAFKYRKEIEQELGIELPPIGMELPPEIENRLSALIAEASEQLLGKQQQEQQQQMNEQAMQDPVVQMQREEIEIEKQKAQSKAQTDQAKLLLDARKEEMRNEIEKLKIETTERIEGAKIGAKIAERQADLNVKEQKISADQETKGAEIGSRIADQLLKGDNNG